MNSNFMIKFDGKISKVSKSGLSDMLNKPVKSSKKIALSRKAINSVYDQKTDKKKKKNGQDQKQNNSKKGIKQGIKHNTQKTSNPNHNVRSTSQIKQTREQHQLQKRHSKTRAQDKLPILQMTISKKTLKLSKLLNCSQEKQVKTNIIKKQNVASIRISADNEKYKINKKSMATEIRQVNQLNTFYNGFLNSEALNQYSRLNDFQILMAKKQAQRTSFKKDHPEQAKSYKKGNALHY